MEYADAKSNRKKKDAHHGRNNREEEEERKKERKKEKETKPQAITHKVNYGRKNATSTPDVTLN